jgi:hypothetical protein
MFQIDEERGYGMGFVCIVESVGVKDDQDGRSDARGFVVCSREPL